MLLNDRKDIVLDAQLLVCENKFRLKCTLKPGPIYFLTPRKCGIFGVCCAALPQQDNFLIDEAFDTGKGANAIISMLHYYLENHGFNATVFHFNANNCIGQNKNNAVIQVNLVKIVYTFLILCSIIVPCVESFDRAK